MRRAGSADLPLHGGRVPAWLGQRMARLGSVITQAIVHHYGRDEFLRRLAHPFWFQSFGAVMGMDWHSSGITTSVIGALKRGLGPLAGELGIHVCGGRGSHSRKTPSELLAIAQRVGLDGDGLATASRLVAKVDSAAVQDGYDLYLHGFILTDDGHWVVVQQGMNGDNRRARRYHWLSENLQSFVEAPHAAIEGANQGRIINLTDTRAAASRTGQVELLRDRGADFIVEELAARGLRQRGAPGVAGVAGVDGVDGVSGTRATRGTPAAPRATRPAGRVAQAAAAQLALPHLDMPAHHDVRAKDVDMRRLRGALAAAAERGPVDFAELLLVPGVGARTVESLALVAEVVHGAPCRFSDPARYAMAHGGKDRHPFPVPLAVYDRTITVLKSAVQQARLGNEDKLDALRRLDRQARLLEARAQGQERADAQDGPDDSHESDRPGELDDAAFEQHMARERAATASFGGRSVFGIEGENPDAPGTHAA